MQALIDAVQRNCDIADARHGGDLGMCTYLLRMRELYRWQRRLPFGARLEKHEVGDWLTARETRLEALEDADFVALDIDGRQVDPFDADAVNAALVPRGLVYSAGLADGGRAQFFLAELEREQTSTDGCTLRVSGREFARCLSAPPAMTRGATIFLRREALRRYLWEKYEAWLWHRPQNAMARALAGYPFDSDLELALDRMTAAEMDVIAAHESGEYEAGRELGEAWENMLVDLVMTPAELMARAVRDHLADCSHTLPLLLAGGREPSLHLFVANLGAMRKTLFPGLQAAYGRWCDNGDRAALEEVAEAGRAHWLRVARHMLALHERHGGAAAKPIAQWVETAAL